MSERAWWRREREPMNALAQHAGIAIRVQDACNLSGVLHSFAAAMAAINEEAVRTGQGTEWRNTHPIVRLFVAKLGSLAHMQGEDAYAHFAEAYAACQVLAEEGER